MADPKQMQTQQPRSGEMQRQPRRMMMSPFDEMERMFESFFPRWTRPWEMSAPGMQGEGRMPAVDVVDRENEVMVRAEIPGVDKDSLEISTTEDTVTIRGSSTHEEKQEEGDYYRCEISRGAFTRTVALPCEVDSEHAKATFNNGVLELTLPKAERSRRHTIPVQ